MISVVFSADDNHVMLLGVALCSMFENKPVHVSVGVFVMDGGISEKNKRRIKILEGRYNFTVQYLTPDDTLFQGLPHSIPAYYRIMLGDLLPRDCHKVLYMDCDVIVRGDLSELFGMDLTGAIVGAVPDDPQAWWKMHLKELLNDVGVEAGNHEVWSFNSGVLLINLDLWRQYEIGKKLLIFIREHPETLWVADQDPLNVVLFGSDKKFPRRYNFLPASTNIDNSENPLIVHFAGGNKPWYRFSALPYQKEYVYYANLTPWKNEKYRKFMDAFFTKKYHFYALAWWGRTQYKKLRGIGR